MPKPRSEFPVPLSEIVPTEEEKRLFNDEFLRDSVDEAIRSVKESADSAQTEKPKPTE